MAKFDAYGNAKVWLKRKTKRKRKGENQGEEYHVFEGSVDTGGGKMITIKCYRVEEVETKNGEIMFPLRVSKWKGTPRTNTNKSKNNW